MYRLRFPRRLSRRSSDNVTPHSLLSCSNSCKIPVQSSRHHHPPADHSQSVPHPFPFSLQRDFFPSLANSTPLADFQRSRTFSQPHSVHRSHNSHLLRRFPHLEFQVAHLADQFPHRRFMTACTRIRYTQCHTVLLRRTLQKSQCLVL